MTIAIIDLGTNTFNLLVAQSNGSGKYNIIHESKYPVKLGEGGLTKKIITPAAWQRGIDAIEKHMQTAKGLSAEKFFAFATSATRDASNGKEFVAEIYNRFGLKIEVIDGSREATLIYKGVRQAIDLGDECDLILDIGGGSNEIILANSKEIFWLKSFDLGVSRLMQLFNPSDPITNEQIATIESHIQKELTPLFDAVKKHKTH
jgi:exopolyphosphatase/guanosine-5'-triphosphate,3'-diphosphate pyrophosphatase